MPILPYNGTWPRIAADAFIAPTATIAGDVTVGTGASVWFGAVIRGDAAPVTIGAGANVQDNCVIHVDAGAPCHIGAGCSLGHGAIVHGARLGNGVLVGMHATVLSHAQVGDGCIIAAGAVVAEGRHIPAATLVMGVPGRAIRAVTDDECARVRDGVEHYRQYARDYASALDATAPRTDADRT